MKKEKTKEKSLSVKILLGILKSPYYLVQGIKKISDLTETDKEKKTKHRSVQSSANPQYSEFQILETIEGDYEKWKESVFTAESKIGLIIGARGSGKTAIGIKLLENIYAKKKKKCYAIGFHQEDFPDWIDVVEDISQITNDSFVLIDEGGVLFSSRKAMTNANKLLSDLILVARHKNLNIIFITQNSSNLEINIIRQADYILLKPSSLLQKEFERKIIQKIYEEISSSFSKHQAVKGSTYIYSAEFKGMISNSLPSFWDTHISKSFK